MLKQVNLSKVELLDRNNNQNKKQFK